MNQAGLRRLKRGLLHKPPLWNRYFVFGAIHIIPKNAPHSRTEATGLPNQIYALNLPREHHSRYRGASPRLAGKSAAPLPFTLKLGLRHCGNCFHTIIPLAPDKMNLFG